jgi:hypothetical protein
MKGLLKGNCRIGEQSVTGHIILLNATVVYLVGRSP